MSSDQVRQTLARLRGELDAFERCKDRFARGQRGHLEALRIRHSLLTGLLMVRATERRKKVVSLALWRWGLAPRAKMLRYGYGPGDSAKCSAPDVAACHSWMMPKALWLSSGKEAHHDHDDDSVAPEAG